MQLTIYHQLIGTKCYTFGKNMVVVGIDFINNNPYIMVHTGFEEAKPSPFHNYKYVVTALYSVAYLSEK